MEPVFTEELKEIKEIIDAVKSELDNAPEELKDILGFYYTLLKIAFKIANWTLCVMLKIDDALQKSGYKVK